jgi:hypothetical protein
MSAGGIGMSVLPTIEGEIDASGRFHPSDADTPVPAGRVLVTVLDPDPEACALLAEALLAEDWLKPEEDEAWTHLSSAR